LISCWHWFNLVQHEQHEARWKIDEERRKKKEENTEKTILFVLVPSFHLVSNEGPFFTSSPHTPRLGGTRQQRRSNIPSRRKRKKKKKEKEEGKRKMKKRKEKKKRWRLEDCNCPHINSIGWFDSDLRFLSSCPSRSSFASSVEELVDPWASWSGSQWAHHLRPHSPAVLRIHRCHWGKALLLLVLWKQEQPGYRRLHPLGTFFSSPFSLSFFFFLLLFFLLSSFLLSYSFSS